MTTAIAKIEIYATTSSWLRSFSGDGYAAATQSTTCINSLLWDMIPESDVRKGWWIDEDLKSPLIDDLTWPGCDGDLAHADDGGAAKLPFLPYTNVKFGCSTVGTTTNDEDMPLIRVEEMYLLEAEAVGMSQGVAAGVEKLNSFMTTYRDPEYHCALSDARAFQLEVLTQERIEFWGEGNAFPNAKRLRPGTIQNYDGTNAPADIFKINCKGIKPNWNFVIPDKETQSNQELNNPDPAATVTGPTPVGEFAPGKF